MMTIILYNNWEIEAKKKMRIAMKDGRFQTVPRINKAQIKEIMALCAKADKAEALTNGVLYQFK